MTNEQQIEVKMGAIRLTGEQSQRLMNIHKSKVLECYEHWDWKLRDLGLVKIGPIPEMLKARKERWIEQQWAKVRSMADRAKVPTEAKLREMEGLLNRMYWEGRLIEKKYTTLTDAGRELAANGRSVVLAKDLTPAKD